MANVFETAYPTQLNNTVPSSLYTYPSTPVNVGSVTGLLTDPLNLDLMNVDTRYPVIRPHHSSQDFVQMDTSTPNVMQQPINFFNGVKNGWNSLSTGDKLTTLGNTVAGIWNAYNGYKQAKLAKEQYQFQRDAFNKQYETQKRLTNSRLEDRQRLRNIENPNSSMSVSEYMNKYGVV